MKFLWKLVLRGGDEIELPETTALSIQVAIKRGEQFYHNPVRTFAIDQIKSLEKTSKVDTEGQRLLADAQAVSTKDEPIIVTLENGEKAVKAYTVKKQITRGEWERYYSKAGWPRTADEGYWVTYTRAAHLGIPPGHVLI